MPVLLAGILTFLTGGVSHAQVKAQVESIGFNKVYRPDSHTPMIVSIRPDDLKTGYYQIQVHQKDIDGHDVVYSRMISLTGTDEGAAREQKFWMDFLPSPQGLPDPNKGATLADLQKELQVFLCDRNGKQIAPVAVRDSIMSVDLPPSVWSTKRGTKLILGVTSAGSQPSFNDYGSPSDPNNSILGVLEDVAMIQIGVRDLPENPVEYDAVDAVIWFNVDPAELKRGNDAKFRALETYVRQGGQLVICQNSEWQKTAEFGDLLPVSIEGMQEKGDLEPLKSLARSTGDRDLGIDQKTREQKRYLDPWIRVPGPHQFARATAKPGTLVDEWIVWDEKTNDRTPYIVRKPFGLGAITWVAQDLGDPALTSRAKVGWPFVWNKVFDWKDEPKVVTSETSADERFPYQHAGTVDLGKSLIQGMEAKSKASLFIATAVAFFLIYWAVAGPGFYVYLVAKRRASLSWFMFGLAALAATGITVLIVKLVLRGPPEVHHLSVVQQAANQPTIVRSRFGLYIPRDGDQKIQLQNTAPQTVSTINGFAINPAYLDSSSGDTPVALQYTVPVRDASSADSPALTVPYQSTLKKFEATWIGEGIGGVDGSARLVSDSSVMISGRITNGTGKLLKNVYIAFKYPRSGEGDVYDDWVLYLPSWDPDVSLDLNREFNGAAGNRTASISVAAGSVPEGGKKLKGLMRWWQDYWDAKVKGATGIGDGFISDADQPVPRSIPIMSFFDRLAPMKNVTDKPDRVEILRRGGRHLDRSAALAAGAMVVLAQAPGPLPFPMTVEGDPVTGTGINFYQYVLPLDRSATEKPATQPAN